MRSRAAATIIRLLRWFFFVYEDLIIPIRAYFRAYCAKNRPWKNSWRLMTKNYEIRIAVTDDCFFESFLWIFKRLFSGFFTRFSASFLPTFLPIFCRFWYEKRGNLAVIEKKWKWYYLLNKWLSYAGYKVLQYAPQFSFKITYDNLTLSEVMILLTPPRTANDCKITIFLVIHYH